MGNQQVPQRGTSNEYHNMGVGHTPNTGTLPKYRNTSEKYRNTLDFITTDILCSHKNTSVKRFKTYFLKKKKKKNYADITLQAYVMKYMFRFKYISTSGRDHKIMGK